MAQKKCPKCGEDNPGEAVMCWACYTPLTGASTTSATPAPRNAPPPSRATRPSREESDRQPPISPGLIGVLAVVLLIGVAVGLKSMMGGSNMGDLESDAPVIKDDDGYIRAAPAPATGPAPVAPSPGGPSSSAPAPLPQVPAPNAGNGFQITALPNPRIPWGTMAIVPTDANLGESQAAALAAFTLRRYTKAQMQRWPRGFYIFVFKDTQTAEIFNNYMRSRRGAPLTPSDYQALAHIWPSTLVRYEYYKEREYVVYPSKNVSGWWLSRGKT